MAEKSLKASWIILTVVKCLILLIGFTFIFLPEQMFLTDTFRSYIGEEWSDFKAAQENSASYFLILHREIGIYALILGVYGLVIVLRPYRKAEKWAWWLSLGGNTAGWAAAIVLSIFLKRLLPTIGFAVLLAVAYVGLVIGAKAIMKKASS